MMNCQLIAIGMFSKIVLCSVCEICQYDIVCGYRTIKPKTVAKAFWVGEVEHELRRLGRQDF